jgi:hypothetical protein
MRLGLNAVILVCLFTFRCAERVFDDERRRSRLGPGRFAGEPRMPPFRFECLAKITRLRI